MALAFKLSPKARCSVVSGLLIVMLLHSIIGLGLVVTGLIVPASIGVKLLPSERVLVDQIFGSLTVMGIVILIVQVSGIKICCNTKKPYRYPKCGYMLSIWSILGIFISILEIAVAALVPMYTTTLTHQLQNTLHRGMGQYLSDLSWKSILDDMQQQRQCCGIERYTDWHRTSWLRSEHLREDSQTVLHYTEMDGRMLPPTIPWSCCAPTSTLPCLHDQLQQLRSRTVWQEKPQTVMRTISVDGCLPVLAKPMAYGLAWTTGIMSTAFILQVVSLIAVRYVYTSARNGVLVGDRKGPAYGWLLGRGDFGMERGQTMDQMDAEREEKKKEKEKKKQEEENPLPQVKKKRRRK